MLQVLTPQQLLTHYQGAVHALRARGSLTLETGIELALHLYCQVKVAGVSAVEAEDDMLLFQYGICDWGDVNGKYFGLDLTRQVTLVAAQEEDPLLYQLRYEFVFDPAPFATCQPYNSWSVAGTTLPTWAAAQRVTPGYELARRSSFRALEVTLSEV
jgi:hypothetical protein